MEVHELDVLAAQDQEDLLAVLDMRFGEIPRETVERIAAIRKPDELQRLILAACNASAWSVFAEELQAGEGAFKLVGERFNPAPRISESEGGNS
ncbi:hypothetical protein [Paenibacillus sp. TH7-28]